eukprot:CAMPEP_0204269806 /NCGR_PEP_ID=MMETSP0468-20130131/17248_1 /ASSEMBLY_ACC=CAM_ASM_000383 /TAXON_ID=2969 /ORGANISM="Oxyrrhis marina" /LENGTH=168 /DNA_ID=CAMNT_0051245249 /DNA_START=363 /DNA_END=869 /DNA_ORIENTATION=-
MGMQPKCTAQFVLRRCSRDVNLVTQHSERNGAQHGVVQQPAQLFCSLWEPSSVRSVDNENDPVNSGEIVLPDPSGRLVTTQIKSAKSNLADDQLFRMRVESGDMSSHPIIFQHVQQCGLACIVQAEEEQLPILLGQSEMPKDVPEPINEKHAGLQGQAATMGQHFVNP